MGLYEDRVKRLHDHVIANEKKAAAEQKKATEPSIAEIKTKLDEMGVEYDKRANKATLMELLEAAQNEIVDSEEDPDDGEGAE